jgi:hypothetical protein
MQSYSMDELPSQPKEKHLRAPTFWGKYGKYRWIIVLILFIIIGIEAIYIAANTTPAPSQTETPPIARQSSPTSSPSPTTDPTENPDLSLKNWKTYTNNEYAFSIQYPPSVTLTEYSQNSEAAAPVIALSFPNDSYTSFSVGISETYKGRETAKEIVDSLLYVRKFGKTKEITATRSLYIVNGVEGEQIISEEIIGDFKRGDIETIIVKDNQVYSFDLRYRAENKQKMLLFADQILSTFKFTE